VKLVPEVLSETVTVADDAPELMLTAPLPLTFVHA
jgi:hypothetical protein